MKTISVLKETKYINIPEWNNVTCEIKKDETGEYINDPVSCERIEIVRVKSDINEFINAFRRFENIEAQTWNIISYLRSIWVML